jgi:hypothetical protein
MLIKEFEIMNRKKNITLPLIEEIEKFFDFIESEDGEELLTLASAGKLSFCNIDEAVCHTGIKTMSVFLPIILLYPLKKFN